MTRIFIRVLAKHRKTVLAECRSTDGPPFVWYEFSYRFDQRFVYSLSEWPAAKAAYTKRLAGYARRRTTRKWRVAKTEVA